MRFLVSIYRWVVGQKPLVGLPVIEVRHDICSACPAHRRSWWRWFCSQCGCTISRRRSIFNKLAHGGEECPLNRWTKL